MRKHSARRFPWIIYAVVLFAILAIALAPVVSVVVCSWVANVHGCKVDEGSVHPCVINGKDYGQMLYLLGVLGWLMLATIPGGIVAVMIWLVILLFHRTQWRKHARANPSTSNDYRDELV